MLHTEEGKEAMETLWEETLEDFRLCWGAEIPISTKE
jgi:hypothetical protein